MDALIEKHRILIVCGTGGVGKTTVSAAIALRAALLGKKTLVITIDPAKRLVTSLGLSELGDEPVDLSEKIPQCKGKLFALMPDTQKTFANLLDTLAPNPEFAEKVRNNSIFQIVSRDYSGANEYMGLWKLNRLDRDGNYDLIILDTPPNRDTLNFLNTPKQLSQFFEERLIRWLVLPANRLVAGSMKKALKILEKLTGQGFLSSLIELAQALFEIQDRFFENVKRIDQALTSESVGFLIVSAPNPDNLSEIESLKTYLNEHDFHFRGMILNRSMGFFGVNEADQKQSTPEEKEALEIVEAMHLREEKVIETLERSEDQILARLPELGRDVHTLEDLSYVANALGR